MMCIVHLLVLVIRMTAAVVWEATLVFFMIQHDIPPVTILPWVPILTRALYKRWGTTTTLDATLKPPTVARWPEKLLLLQRMVSRLSFVKLLVKDISTSEWSLRMNESLIIFWVVINFY